LKNPESFVDRYQHQETYKQLTVVYGVQVVTFIIHSCISFLGRFSKFKAVAWLLTHFTFFVVAPIVFWIREYLRSDMNAFSSFWVMMSSFYTLFIAYRYIFTSGLYQLLIQLVLTSTPTKKSLPKISKIERDVREINLIENIYSLAIAAMMKEEYITDCLPKY